MRVAVVGAAGFLGGEVVRSLSAAGHEVRGLVRRSEQRDAVLRRGGIPVLGDVVTGRGLEEALAGCEQVVHLAQTDSPDIEARRQVRVDGARQLVRTAAAAGVRRIVVGSGYWVYRSNPGEIVEGSPLEPRSISQVNFEAEMVVRDAAAPGELEAVVVRPGMVYGPGSWFAQMVSELIAGTYRFVADGANFLSPVHLADTGLGFRTLVERGRDGETYLLVDDSPVPTREFAESVAVLVGALPPRGIEPAEAVATWGADLAALESASRRASNAKLRRLGWSPKFPTFRDGVPGVLQALVG